MALKIVPPPSAPASQREPNMKTINTAEETLEFNPMEERDRPFWVVERYVNGRLCFWSPGARGRSSRDEWSEDIGFAIKMADYDSSQIALVHACGGEGRAVLHQFIKTEPDTDKAEYEKTRNYRKISDPHSRWAITAREIADAEDAYGMSIEKIMMSAQPPKPIRAARKGDAK